MEKKNHLLSSHLKKSRTGAQQTQEKERTIIGNLNPNKNCRRRHFHFLLLSFEKKIRLDFSGESSAKQRIHLKHQVIFSPKTMKKIFMNVICCSRDWRFKGLSLFFFSISAAHLAILYFEVTCTITGELV